MLKQQSKVGGMKIKRFDERCQQFKQKKIFFEPTRSCFTMLDEKKQRETGLPDPEETTSSWSRIWSEEVNHD